MSVPRSEAYLPSSNYGVNWLYEIIWVSTNYCASLSCPDHRQVDRLHSKLAQYTCLYAFVLRVFWFHFLGSPQHRILSLDNSIKSLWQWLCLKSSPPSNLPGTDLSKLSSADLEWQAQSITKSCQLGRTCLSLCTVGISLWAQSQIPTMKRHEWRTLLEDGIGIGTGPVISLALGNLWWGKALHQCWSAIIALARCLENCDVKSFTQGYPTGSLFIHPLSHTAIMEDIGLSNIESIAWGNNLLHNLKPPKKRIFPKVHHVFNDCTCQGKRCTQQGSVTCYTHVGKQGEEIKRNKLGVTCQGIHQSGRNCYDPGRNMRM